MKYVRLAILLLLIPLCCVAFAALVKTTSKDQLDGWRLVPFGVLSVGVVGNISNSYDTILYLEIAYADGNAQDGVEVSVEVSYGDDDWTLLTQPFTTPDEESGPSDTIDGQVGAGTSTVVLVDGTFFDTPGQKFFIEDGSSSETVRIKSESAGTITLCHDFQFTHVTTTPVWYNVHEYIIPIPTAFAFVRVLIDNTDDNANIRYTTRLSKVTSL